MNLKFEIYFLRYSKICNLSIFNNFKKLKMEKKEKSNDKQTTILGGNFILKRKLGKGAFGKIYLGI